MTDSEIRFGIVGCGAVHHAHVDAVSQIPGATVKAFYDIDPDRSQKSAHAYGGVASDSLESLCAGVDVACICVPSGLHASVGSAIAKTNTHIVCEKPIDVSMASAKQLIEICEESEVLLCVISQHRFASDVQRLRKRVTSGELGELLTADMYNKWFRTSNYYESELWRGTLDIDGGGCLMNQGIHYVDLLQWIAGGIKSVQAQTKSVRHRGLEVEDTANVLVEYDCGAIGVIQASTATFPGFAERLEISGSWGSAVIETDSLKIWHVDKVGVESGIYGRGVVTHPFPRVEIHGEIGEPGRAREPGTHRHQLEDFVCCVRESRTPLITGQEAIVPLQAILAVYESARRGGDRVFVSEIQ